MDFVKSAQPVISAQQLGIYGKAPHLNGAKLFAEWMITPEGQLAVAAVGRETSRKGVKSKASVEYAWGDKVKPIPIVNKSFSEDPRKWLGCQCQTCLGELSNPAPQSKRVSSYV